MKINKLTRNRIQCLHCDDIIESKHVHEFVWCKCQTVAVDGGLDYAKRCFRNSPEDFLDLSEWKEVEVEEGDYIWQD